MVQSLAADMKRKTKRRRGIGVGDNKAKLAKLKATLKCSRCQEARPHCLDFHHVGKVKRFTISQAVGSHAWETILEEIQQCEVLCANCHRDEHFQVRARRLAELRAKHQAQEKARELAKKQPKAVLYTWYAGTPEEVEAERARITQEMYQAYEQEFLELQRRLDDKAEEREMAETDAVAEYRQLEEEAAEKGEDIESLEEFLRERLEHYKDEE